jgi:hypothetical protein
LFHFVFIFIKILSAAVAVTEFSHRHFVFLGKPAELKHGDVVELRAPVTGVESTAVNSSEVNSIESNSTEVKSTDFLNVLDYSLSFTAQVTKDLYTPGFRYL